MSLRHFGFVRDLLLEGLSCASVSLDFRFWIFEFPNVSQVVGFVSRRMSIRCRDVFISFGTVSVCILGSGPFFICEEAL